MKYAPVLTLILALPAAAQPPVVNTATIDTSGARYQGVLSVNQAAGDLQQQANARAIALGQETRASTQVRQQVQVTVDPSMGAAASIQGTAFSAGNGLLGVNQSAGAANQQANAVRLSVSAQPLSLDDSVLMQQNVTLVNHSGATDTSTGYRQVSTSDQAFTGSRGVIQLNQSAGVGNRTANTLSVRVTQ